MAEKPERWPIAEDLYVTFVDVASLREQDLNAQVMQPRHFDRLTENIRQRGQVESLPYCAQPRGEGPVEIVSGHHRARAARQAGLDRIPVLLDTRPMRRSEIIAKQIAHNELHGAPDEDVLRQLIAMIDNVDDLLTTGLPEELLPTVDQDDTTLAIPHGEFDWRMVTFVFLPHQLRELQEAIKIIDSGTELIGVADLSQFDEFAAAIHAYGRCKDVRNMATIIALLTDLARREVEAELAARADREDQQ